MPLLWVIAEVVSQRQLLPPAARWWVHKLDTVKCISHPRNISSKAKPQVPVPNINGGLAPPSATMGSRKGVLNNVRLRALASGRLDDFVGQEVIQGSELLRGSELE